MRVRLVVVGYAHARSQLFERRTHGAIATVIMELS